jgi:high-affinity nickel-transport protein
VSLPPLDAVSAVIAAVAADAGIGLIATGLVLGIRHGFDWDHIAAIADITSTTAAADAGIDAHERVHRAVGPVHDHPHGGPKELRAHEVGAGAATNSGAAIVAGDAGPLTLSRAHLIGEQRRAIVLGTLYALGHAAVVAALGLAALLFGALLPEWVDPIMARVVGITLLVLGVWVFYSLYQYARHGRAFRLRSRWMLVFDGVRHGWRRFQARLHGHEHADPMEMSSYGPRTAFGVGIIHGIGAETGSQVLIIAAVGGAAGQGLGVPMMLAFIVGLVISNSIIVIITATGFVTSQLRQRAYLVVGVLAGTFSIVVGTLFLLEAETVLPDLGQLLAVVPD